MTDYKEILRLNSLGVTNLRIADALGYSRTTVIRVIDTSKKLGISTDDLLTLSSAEIKTKLFPAENLKQYKMPDYEYIHKELTRPGVTLSLLWVEYCEACRNSKNIPYQSTQFYKYYADYVQKNRATMHINRKPGDIMEVDWAGKTATITDSVTGDTIKAYIFVSALAYSRYAYVEAFLSCGENEWIAAHNRALKHYGGVTRIIVSDNLKTGVISNTKEETIINRNYQDMAEHYDTAIIPARVKKPRDKPATEGEVSVVSTWIVAALRNSTFFTLDELNVAIKEKLKGYNERTFQKKEGSRASMFAEEKTFLKPLPMHLFELATWKTAKVQDNYHIQHDGKYYSVPYEYIGKSVDLRITASAIEVLYGGMRICSHLALKAHEGRYSTVEAHMPEKHQKYGSWDGDRFRKWADKFGKNTRTVVDYLLSIVKVEQQAYKACRALLHLADKYSAQRLEAACSKALSFTPYPSFRSVQAILKSGRDKVNDEESNTIEITTSDHGFTRGSGYYGGDGK